MSETITVKSPYDGSHVGEVPKMTVADVDRAIRAAQRAVVERPLPAWRRAEILTTASDLIGERREELARVIAREAAKPIATARVEAGRALSTIGFSALEARKLTGDVVPMEGSMVGEGKFAYTLRVPVGVVAAITPFNFPLNLVAHKVGPALAAGCPVVLKPASQTPFSAFALADILRDAGLPDGWLTVVTGSGSEVGAALLEHPDVAMVSFTGSSEVGWKMQQSAPRKRVSLELGNSTPLIVHSDGDWRKAVKGAVAGGFNHAGQSCVSVQRVYVHASIATDFTDALVEATEALSVGDPMDEATNVSSLISTDERDRVKAWIDEAVQQGATLRCGGEVEDTVLTPAVLTDTTPEMKVQSDEVFGPVIAVQTYETVDEAIDLANGTRYGLQAGIFTSDINIAMRVSRELEFGGVLINETPTWRADVMPYGGVKDSGNAKEGPAYAVRSMTHERLVVIDL